MTTTPMAWATHHEPPMLFPTRAEADAFCDDDEDPIPLLPVPEGWRVVPVEPTPAMIAANGRSDVPDGREWLERDARQTWAAMLDAAPEAP